MPVHDCEHPLTNADVSRRRSTPRRTGLVSVAVLIVAIGLIAVWRRNFAENQAVEEIHSLGGIADVEFSGPQWLENFADMWGGHGFRRVCHVNLSDIPIGDSFLTRFAALPDVRVLDLVELKSPTPGSRKLRISI